MEIHFYESKKIYPENCEILHDWESTKGAIDNLVKEIHTTQMCMLSTSLFLKDYRVFVHQGNGFAYEITLQNKDNNGTHTVRLAQNMYVIWAGNFFRK